ncbi:VWA domain-containing protein [Halostreptopolyspora alba]|uniref:VWA domain-containing protein n=2 Tax=Halostreptopolyspora alba TaxID=2487137 RepID=A0A3N0EIY7_9ACTN|nr:VWA domain-containing protein [Nocardiopsaceae bacterium YIM 96095]
MLAAAGEIGVTDRESAYWAGRLTLCGEPDDIPTYDAAFAAYFSDAPALPPTPQTPPRATRRPTLLFAPSRPGTGEADEDETTVASMASDTEVLRYRDIAALSAAEREEVRRMLALLAPGTAPRRTRRFRPAARGPVDPRATVRRMLRQAGEPTRLARRRRGAKPRRLVLLLDVSGSMAPYADALLRFAHAAVRRRPTLTEVFTVGTRLTRVTRALRHRDPDVALGAVSRAIPDWHGGTRLADSVTAFLDRWGRRGTARGAVVVICSDGWERGDPTALGDQVAHLSRLAHRLVWANPHRGKPGYAPLVGGMAAVLPYLDDFVAGHSLASLEELVGVIARA